MIPAALRDAPARFAVLYEYRARPMAARAIVQVIAENPDDAIGRAREQFPGHESFRVAKVTRIGRA